MLDREQNIRKHFEWLGLSEVEVRIFDKDFNRIWFKEKYKPDFVKSAEQLIEIYKAYPNCHIFVGINQRENQGTKIEDIKIITNLAMDLDNKGDFLKTQETAFQIIKDNATQGFKQPLLVCSGGGFHIYFPTSPIENSEENRLKLKAFGQNLKAKYETKDTEIDVAVFEPARVMRLAGTQNQKPEVQSPCFIPEDFLNFKKENDVLFTQEFLAITPKDKIVVGELGETFKEVLSRDKIAEALFNGDLQKSESLGLQLKDKSKSGQEIALIDRLVALNFDKEQIFKIMPSCKIGKWNTANIKYRERTYNKALEFVSWEKKKKEILEIPETKEIFNIKRFNNTSVVFVNGEIYNHLKKSGNQEGVSFATEYNLFQGSVGQGNKAIIIKTTSQLDKGDNKLYLKQLSNKEIRNTLWKMKQEGFNALCRTLKVNILDSKKELRTREELVEDILNYEDYFFELTLAVSPEELQKIGNPFEVAKQILKNGLEKDKLIDYISIADIPEVEPNSISPKDYMKFSPHKILITNEKVGKTTNAMLITGEPTFEKPTEAGLLGFADSKGKNYGKLHKRTKQSYLEEVQEEKSEELFGKLHTYMELGETSLVRGVGISIFGFSGLTFQGNPKTKGDLENTLLDYLTIKAFRDFLGKISGNISPFASRIGLTIFNKNLKQVVGNTKDKGIAENGHKIIRAVAEGYKKEFTQLFFEDKVLDWLNTDFDKEYKNCIQDIINTCSDRVVQEYLKGQLSSFRHTRGIALRLAWLEKGLESLWTSGKVNIIELLDCAEEHYQKLKAINLQSYSNIISLINSKAYDTLLEYNLKYISPEYLKLVLYTLFEWRLQNPINKDKVIPLNAIEVCFDTIKDRLRIESKSKYGVLSSIINYLDKFQGSITSQLEDFGLEYDSLNKSFVIINFSQLEKYNQLFQTLKVEKVEKVEG